MVEELVQSKEVRRQEVTRSVMRLRKAVKTCVLDLFEGKLDALILRSENSAKHIEFCSIEIHKCVSMVNAATVRVDALDKGFSRLEAQVASTPSSSAGDISMAENLDNEQCFVQI